MKVMDWILRVNYYYELTFSSYKNFAANGKFIESNSYDSALKEFKKKASDLLNIKGLELEPVVVDADGSLFIKANIKDGEYISLFDDNEVSECRESGLYDRELILYTSWTKPFENIALANDKQLKEVTIENYLCKQITAIYNQVKKSIEADDVELQKLSRIRKEYIAKIEEAMNSIKERLLEVKPAE